MRLKLFPSITLDPSPFAGILTTTLNVICYYFSVLPIYNISTGVKYGEM